MVLDLIASNLGLAMWSCPFFPTAWIESSETHFVCRPPTLCMANGGGGAHISKGAVHLRPHQKMLTNHYEGMRSSSIATLHGCLNQHVARPNMGTVANATLATDTQLHKHVCTLQENNFSRKQLEETINTKRKHKRTQLNKTKTKSKSNN